ncbi:MAG TPA: DUF6089 family protein [Salinivirgaceae bacterium]|nr:DUF6089 family protein [Salinivirgaceae bacterium]HQA75950.1 DUF6089 family protein [Salinivirgaceae bacterium]
MNKTILLIGITLISVSVTFGQRNAWQRQRYDVFAGVGGTNFMGDLGGGKSSHWLLDLDMSATRPLFVVGGRYKILEPLAAGVSLSFGYLRGDDKWSNNEFRKRRNLNFRSPIVEFATYAEYHFLKEKFERRAPRRRANFFSLQTIKSLPINAYVFTGIGLFWFNPQGMANDGKWYKLREIGTEGQYVIPTRKPYKRIQVAIPFGVGARYAINRKFSIGLEYAGRFTFTDYIDDVSRNYVSTDFFTDPIAQYLVNPGLPDENGNPYSVGPNDKRGNSLDDDYYMFTVITLSYKMRTGRRGLPKF